MKETKQMMIYKDTRIIKGKELYDEEKCCMIEKGGENDHGEEILTNDIK